MTAVLEFSIIKTFTGVFGCIKKKKKTNTWILHKITLYVLFYSYRGKLDINLRGHLLMDYKNMFFCIYR